MYDVIIIGRGPAGLSAALYVVRAGQSALVVAQDDGQIAKAEKVDNYYGFSETTSGPELQKNALAQARRLGVDFAEGTVTGIVWDDHFRVSSAEGEWEARAVILATGMPKRKSRLQGLDLYEGKGVSYCATCDGFFYRGKTVGVIGNADYALHEIHDLVPFAGSIFWLTNGRPVALSKPLVSLPDKTSIDERPLAKVDGDGEVLREIVFEDGCRTHVDGIFVAEGTASATDFALKLGIETAGNAIRTDRDGRTNLPGFFAAGDCTGGILQISVAVGEGATAGLAAAKFVREKKAEEKKAAT
ncbi:MAG: NAD(P)/FAD-dependent oxidoreductase [Clostridiaceae bacterium]|jgi:thioredoxin reductase (NADPH)|nr:NAD(P)/FAD-dependent oxidoreductase [Clostridiaceae bacterium]